MEIHLFSDIMPGMAAALQQQVGVINEGETVDIHINSAGGSVTEGIAIVNLLNNIPNRVNTHINGLAASMATVIALAGEHVTMSDGSLFMIHDAHFTQGGTAKQMKANADIAESLSSTIANVYKAKTGLAIPVIRDLMAAETTFTAKEAKKHGFVDKVTKPMSMKIAAKFDININDMNLKEEIVNLGKTLLGNPEKEEVIEQLAEAADVKAQKEVSKEVIESDDVIDTLTGELTPKIEFKAFQNTVIDYIHKNAEFMESQKSNEELKEDLKTVVREELNVLLLQIKSKANIPVSSGFDKKEVLGGVIMKKVTEDDMHTKMQSAINKKFKKQS